MILTPNQIQVLRDLQFEMGEVVAATMNHDWESVKDKRCGLTFEMVLDWFKKMQAIFPEDRN